MDDKNLKKCVLKVLNFVRKIQILENPRIFFLNLQNFFFFVLKCKQKEHVHNLNRRWARSALKAWYLYDNEMTNDIDH